MAQLRQLLQFHPDLQRAVHADMMNQQQTAAGDRAQRQPAGNGDGQNEPGHQLEMLRSKAQSAHRAGKRDVAMELWQQVLRTKPDDYQANRAGGKPSSLLCACWQLAHLCLTCSTAALPLVGMALSYKDEFEKAMPYLDTALRHQPTDYTLSHYAGINQKLRSDRLPDTEQPLKRKLWEAAIIYCETARHNFPARARGQEPSWNDRFFFIHCCEPYEALGRPVEKSACNGEALALGIWKTAGQRPGRYDPSLRAQPWWKLDELGRSTAHAELLRSNWKMIRKEANRILKAAQRDDLNDTAVADASGFALEGAGLHAQRSWHEYSLWAFGKKDTKHCRRTPFTCDLLERMPEATRTTVGDIKFSLMQPGTIVRPHTGPSNQRIRVHLGLKVPQHGCEITVAGETRGWAEGELLIFDGNSLTDLRSCL